MKDLITVFTYCPDNKRKKVLQELLGKLESIRNKFDILVVSHSEIPELCYDNIDFFYYDKNNKLLDDFDLNNNFWFKSESFYLNSTTVYPKSTHLAIYSLLYYTFNFAKHKGYDKVHCIEYDINLIDLDLLNLVNSRLDEKDVVMFKREDGWVFGTYFAFTMNNFPDEYYFFNEDNITNTLRDSDSRMTENITPIILTINNRTIHFESSILLDPNGVFQTIDNHNNDELNWCVPVCDKNSDKVYLFTFNNNGGNFSVDVIFGNSHIHLDVKDKGVWNLIEMGNIHDIDYITILVNSQIKKRIYISNNKNTFKKYNFIQFND